MRIRTTAICRGRRCSRGPYASGRGFVPSTSHWATVAKVLVRIRVGLAPNRSRSALRLTAAAPVPRPRMHHAKTHRRAAACAASFEEALAELEQLVARWKRPAAARAVARRLPARRRAARVLPRPARSGRSSRSRCSKADSSSRAPPKRIDERDDAATLRRLDARRSRRASSRRSTSCLPVPRRSRRPACGEAMRYARARRRQARAPAAGVRRRRGCRRPTPRRRCAPPARSS